MHNREPHSDHHRVAKRGSLVWWHGLVLASLVGWLGSCASPQTAVYPTTPSQTAPQPAWQLARTTPQPSDPRLTPEGADPAQAATIGHSPLYAWPNSTRSQTKATGQTGTSPALSILAYEKILLDRVSPTPLRHLALTALLNAPNLRVDLLSDSVLIAAVLDTLHHSERIRQVSRRFMMKFASAKVARAYEAVLADLRANLGSDQESAHYQDWLARIGLEMYYTYGERQMQHMVEPTAESRLKLAQAIASFQKAWALRTLVPTGRKI